MWGDADAADANQAYIPTDEGLAGHGHGFFAFGVKEREMGSKATLRVGLCVQSKTIDARSFS